VVSVSTIGCVTVLTVWSLFLPLDCNCSYDVLSVSTIGFVAVLTVWSLFLPLGCNSHRKNSYKHNGRNRDHTVRTVTNTMVETETTRKNCYKSNGRTETIRFVTVLTVWSLFLPLGL
jgi:hypothetical protein